jgi:predicted GIY-YIG superfamily endonuclease
MRTDSQKSFHPDRSVAIGFINRNAERRDLLPGLVCYESFDVVFKAIDSEKQLKRWTRMKKVWLIEC